jgi:hypothetical protein
MIVTSDGYQIDFTDAISAFKFDETDKTKFTYHGVTALKAVDIIAEFPSAYVFVEIKDYQKPEDFDEINAHDEVEKNTKHLNYKRLKNYLKYKFRDSFLYRFAENKISKPISYICLINLDNALNTKMSKDLRLELPIGKKSTRWVNEFSHVCNVLNLKKWNDNFPKWPAQKI